MIRWPYATSSRTKGHQRRPFKNPYRRPRAPFPLHTRFINDCARENNGKRISKNVCLGLKVICLFLKQDIWYKTSKGPQEAAHQRVFVLQTWYILRQHMLGNLGTRRALYNLNPTSGTDENLDPNYHIKTLDYLRAPKNFLLRYIFPSYSSILYISFSTTLPYKTTPLTASSSILNRDLYSNHSSFLIWQQAQRIMQYTYKKVKISFFVPTKTVLSRWCTYNNNYCIKWPLGKKIGVPC